MGLRDQPHPGRPCKGTTEERERLCEAAKESPHQIRGLPGLFKERTGQAVSRDTVRRWLKGKGLAWKRCRRSLKAQRDEAAFLEGKRVLAALHKHEEAGEIDVFYLDESGFSARSCLPYAWQETGATLCLPANVPGRKNVIGFLSRNNEGHFHPVDGTVTHREVMAAMRSFIDARRPDKLTVVVMDL
jgi:hypothetical protein